MLDNVMNIYNILFLYLLLISFLDFFNNERLKNIFFYASFMLLVLFGGLRFDTGWDYPGYQYYYEKVPIITDLFTHYTDFSSIYFEPGFKLLMSLLKFIGVNFQGLIFIINLITTWLFFVFINRTGKFLNYKNVMVLLYFSTVFLYTNFSVLRQGIAIGIWLLSLNYLNKNNLKYYIFVLIGCLFHYTLLIFFILPVMIYLKPRSKFIILLMVAATLVYILGIKWINLLSPLFPDFIQDKLNHYWSSDRFGSTRSLGIGFVEKFVFMILILYFYFSKLKNGYVRERFYSYMIIYLLYFLCYMLFFEANIIYDRTRLYFASFSICIFPFLLMFFTRKSRLFINLLVVFYSLFFFNKILSSEQNKVVFIPYHSIFSDELSIPEYQKGHLRIDLGMELDGSKL